VRILYHWNLYAGNYANETAAGISLYCVKVTSKTRLFMYFECSEAHLHPSSWNTSYIKISSMFNHNRKLVLKSLFVEELLNGFHLLKYHMHLNDWLILSKIIMWINKHAVRQNRIKTQEIKFIVQPPSLTSHIHKERKWGKALFLFRNFSPLSWGKPRWLITQFLESAT